MAFDIRKRVRNRTFIYSPIISLISLMSSSSCEEAISIGSVCSGSFRLATKSDNAGIAPKSALDVARHVGIGCASNHDNSNKHS